MNKPSGYILFTSMVVLLLWTFLLISLLQSVNIYYKLSSEIGKRHQAFNRLEIVTKQIMAFSSRTECFFRGGEANKVLGLVNTIGCRVEQYNTTYQYLISDLGIFSCLQIRGETKMFSSHQWLVTVKDVVSQDLLQLRVAEATTLLPCDVKKNIIKPGVMSWRYIKRT